ncbi:Phosphatidylinositol-3-phosphatase SAC1 [Conoideocrella luteorostrata]|uniref:Phosphatidylinositol-3-phosphatase SAC1 n=1 Tax=Conoideocrella luteorostrata TaxID=1105319 RepID=A0AAJ0FU43_9HYPO|nr:Phosphatidylinositol-3-phosphatase SAC1 [Conoideocrella luteorostrata]
MSSLDVEALLEATAQSSAHRSSSTLNDDSSRKDRNGRAHNGSDRDGSKSRDDSRDRERDVDYDRHRRRDGRDLTPPRHRKGTPPGETTPRSDTGSHRSRRRSESRDRDRFNSRRSRDGDYYRGRRGGRSRSRSRSPRRRHRPRDDRDRRDRRERSDRRDQGRARDRSPGRRSRSPQLNEDERDSRTVFVQQLAARLRSDKLKKFFEENAGSVNEAQIVKDRISGRSKGVGYVEFKSEDTVQKALQLTGKPLAGIPIIVKLTEAEKNRQARNTESTGNHPNSIPFHRLYVGNIHFNVTEQDLQAVFEPFGLLEYVQLQKDDNGRSRGYGFVQFRDAVQAREALEKMNGFDLAGRPIRVGLGNDKFTPESTANLMHRFSGQNNFQGSAFSGAGGRGSQASTFDRAGGRDSDKAGGASALDDTDVAGVNFNNYSRDALMRKLARTDELPNGREDQAVLKPKTEAKPLPVNVNMASRCVVLHNMFDPEEEEGEDWVKELEEDIRAEAEKQYGHVVHISVDPNSKGDVYLKFDKVQGGENAIKGLNGRYFGGRMINASPVVDAVYSSLFSRTRAI